MTIENPRTIEEHIALAKTLIGEPAIKVRVSDLQARLAVKKSLRMFVDYHMAVYDEGWFEVDVTKQIIDEGAFYVPDHVTQVIEVYTDIGNSFRTLSDEYARKGFMDYFFLNQANSAIYGDKVTMTLVQQEMSYYDNIVNPPMRFLYTDVEKKVQILGDLSKLEVGSKIAFRASINMMETNSKIWDNDWFIEYTAALIKKQWGSNMTKYESIELPNGNRLNGQKIYDDAVNEIAALEEKLLEEHSTVSSIVMIG